MHIMLLLIYTTHQSYVCVVACALFVCVSARRLQPKISRSWTSYHLIPYTNMESFVWRVVQTASQLDTMCIVKERKHLELDYASMAMCPCTTLPIAYAYA